MPNKKDHSGETRWANPHGETKKTIGAGLMKNKYTSKQGQYLAFIHYYTKIHRRPPAEADLEEHFRVAYSSIHQMVVRLESRGLITRTPGEARSIHVLVPPGELPDLL